MEITLNFVFIFVQRYYKAIIMNDDNLRIFQRNASMFVVCIYETLNDKNSIFFLVKP
jgi:hypothetical protein